MKRLQGKEYHKLKHTLRAYAYSVTDRGNICVYYHGKFYHYLNEEEKASFNSDGLLYKPFNPTKKKEGIPE